MKRRILLAILLPLLLSTSAWAEEAALTVLSVGNSFSEDAQRHFSQIAEASGKMVVARNASIGGCDLERHMRHIDAFEADPNDPEGRPYYGGKRSLKDMLTERPWDFVTIQQVSSKSFKPETFHPHADRLIAYIRKHAPRAEILIHQTWAYRVDHTFWGREDFNPDAMYRGLRTTYDKLAKENGFRLIPCGDAMEAARLDPAWGKFVADPSFDPKKAVYPELPKGEKRALHTGYYWRKDTESNVWELRSDKIHANVAGEYLLGCVWFEFFFDQSVVGNRFVPEGLGAEDAAILQRVAHRVVTEKQRPEENLLWHPSRDAAWELSFEDNFEDNKLDESNWFPGYRLGRVEYYTRIGYPNAHTCGWQPNPPLAHYDIKDGVLDLRVDSDLPKREKPASKTVSALTSAIYRYDEATEDFRDDVKFSQKYGWWEMRCRMPDCGSGAYTAFWLHSVGARNQEYSPEGVRGGNPGGNSRVLEIDIFEWLGKSPNKNLFNVHFTKNGSKVIDCPDDMTKEFHTWAINWEEGRITWYLDGEPVHLYEGPTPEGKMYLLMAMFQIGGWVGEVDENLPYPLDFEIDHVKVWKKKF